MVWSGIWNALRGRFVPAAGDGRAVMGSIEAFLDDVLPAAEAAGVELALHPDDPPMKNLRGQPRLVYQPSLYQR